MSIESISSINCDLRNNYDKEFCTGLNPDKINSFIKPYEDYPFGYIDNNESFFDKNIYSLENEGKEINELDKKKCASYCIDNKYGGFTYKGDKNKCMLFNSHNFSEPNVFNNYKIKTFLKTKDTIDIKNIEDQTDSSKYFTEINNENKISNDIIGVIDVSNQDQCIDSCVQDYNNCKSVIYMEQPKVCTFYNNKKMKSKNIEPTDYDTYTVKNKKVEKQKNIVNNLLINSNNLDEDYYYCKLSNNQCFSDYSTPNFEKDTKITEKIYNPDIPIYNCSGFDSTNPFCTKEYNENDYIKKNYINYTDCENIVNNHTDIFNNSCKKKYGDEYIFDDDIYNMKSVLKCEDGGKRGKCKLNFSIPILENYENENENKNKNNILFFILFLIIIGFILLII